jgi:hypothetical protein
MKHYRVITFPNGTAALQSRRPGFIPRWLTLALGLPDPLRATAARMEADRSSLKTAH